LLAPASALYVEKYEADKSDRQQGRRKYVRLADQGRWIIERGVRREQATVSADTEQIKQ